MQLILNLQQVSLQACLTISFPSDHSEQSIYHMSFDINRNFRFQGCCIQIEQNYISRRDFTVLEKVKGIVLYNIENDLVVDELSVRAVFHQNRIICILHIHIIHIVFLFSVSFFILLHVQMNVSYCLS